MKTEAVGYLRVSSKGQQKDGSGLDRQEETIRAFAKQNGYDVISIYKEAETGTDAEREVFLAMLADLLSNGCKVIIVERLDRLARDLQVQMQLIGLLCSKGVVLISADTQQNITEAYQSDPMNKLVLQIIGAVSECDKSMIVQKLKKGREAKKAKTGSCEGRKPFGHYEGETETLTRIKQLHRKVKGEKRRGPYQIAKVLDDEGLKPRNGKKWDGSTIRRILAWKERFPAVPD